MTTSGLVDDAGTTHAPAGDGAHIVSLVPSITELLFDLGLGGALVGRTAFCVHPADRIKTVRSVGGTKQVNFEKLRRAAPTHVVVNIDETPRDLAEEIAGMGITVVVTHPIEVRDNIVLYRLIGGLFGREAEAEALVGRFDDAYADVRRAAEALPERRVLYLIWKEPWMTVSAETYIARMLALIGWTTVGHDPNVRYPAIELTESFLNGTDLVLFSTEPFPFTDRHIADFAEAFPGHAAKAHLIDAQMTSWYGSRAIAGLRYLGALATAWS